MCENAGNLSREKIEVSAAVLKILMWECPRENGRLILRPAALLSNFWPSVIKAQLTALEALADPSVLGITREERNESIEALRKVYEEAHGRFINDILMG